jgi:hypothetical protein
MSYLKKKSYEKQYLLLNLPIEQWIESKKLQTFMCELYFANQSNCTLIYKPHFAGKRCSIWYVWSPFMRSNMQNVIT